MESGMIRLKRMERRGKIEVYLDVLRVIKREGYVGPTRLMYRSNLSTAPLKRILSSLINNGLVDEIKGPGGKRAYCLTDEGKKALETLESAYFIVKKMGKVKWKY